MTKRMILTVCVLVMLTATVTAQWQYLGYEQITVANSSIGITATVLQPNGGNTQPQANVGACRIETAQIRWRVDGVAPTSSVGTLAEIGDVIPLDGADALIRFRMIRTGGTSGVANCTVAQK